MSAHADQLLYDIMEEFTAIEIFAKVHKAGLGPHWELIEKELPPDTTKHQMDRIQQIIQRIFWAGYVIAKEETRDE